MGAPVEEAIRRESKETVSVQEQARAAGVAIRVHR